MKTFKCELCSDQVYSKCVFHRSIFTDTGYLVKMSAENQQKRLTCPHNTNYKHYKLVDGEGMDCQLECGNH